MPDLATSYIFYLAAYRFVNLLVGAFALYLGYRLFVQGVWPESVGGTEIAGQIAGQRFTIKNAAPGAVIGLFGVAVIAAMVLGNPPQASFEQMADAPAFTGEVPGSPGSESSPPAGTSSRILLRGPEPAAEQHPTIARLVARGVEAEAQGDLDAAAEHYQHSLDLIAAPLNNLAWLRFSDGDAERALPLASLAVALSPDNSAFLHTLAEIQLRLGRIEEAKTHIRRAAELDPDTYADMLIRFEVLE
jgi:tetratricopeptide (TPR) repeat protein